MIRLYNSYTKKKQIFRPQKGKTVTMYNCGPTIYDYVHIGNLRSFLFADILRRYLEYRGYKVKQVMNITDVGHMTTDADAGEDKMSLAMKRENKGPREVARFYEEKFFEDIKALGIKPAWKYPRATDHIKEMVAIVKKLVKNGHAYLVVNHNPPHPSLNLREGDRGEEKRGYGRSVYYDLSTFPNYGKLSGNKLDDLIPGARAEVIHEKRNPYDFALWIYKPNHIMQWPSPWGRGYPGWHLECSAMAMRYLGHTIDIHTGGEDNKFPHHECEIAQTQGATGKQFVHYWLHIKHLLVNGKKMSKSLGNFYTLRDLIKKDYSARQIRYLLISNHYRETLNFTFEGLDAAQKALERIDEFVEKLNNPTHPPLNLRGGERRGYTSKARRDFIAAMDDDLNVPKALAVVFDFIRKMNRHKEWDVEFLKEVDSVLGLGIDFKRKKPAIPDQVMMLVGEREQARKNKDWKQADVLRAQIKQKGYTIEDTPQGPAIKATFSF